MGKYSVPADIRALRPDGTQIKRQGDLFYVYETSSTKKKIPQDDGTFVWKTVTKSGRCIGRITLKDGFVPNGNRLRDDSITVLGYGDYAFALKSTGTLRALNASFHAKDAAQIYVAAIITVVEGFTYMKDMADVYSESFLSLEYPGVYVGVTALRTLYENLGKRTSRPTFFQQSLIDTSSGKIAFDGHVIACTSEKNDLSEYGYKAKKLNSPQINWMSAYDVETGKPVANEMFNGADPDKTAVQQFFERFSFKDTLFIVDRGFNTATDKALMSANGNSYIIPMIHGRSDYTFVHSSIRLDKRKNFIYDKDGYSSLVYYHDFRKDGRRYVAYVDTTRQAAERRTYAENLKARKKGFTEEGLLESEKDFGLFMLETSDMAKTPREVFSDYKSRWKIETFYNYVDNIIDFNALYQQDYCRTQGLSFIIQVAGLIYHELKELANPHNLSVKEVMKSLKGIMLSREKNEWKIKNAVKPKRRIAEKLSIDLKPIVTSPA